MSKYLIQCRKLINQDTYNGKKLVNVNVDQMQVFVIINNNTSRCECKELIEKGICDKGFIWNPDNCECECDKSCDVENIQIMKLQMQKKIS